VLDGVDIAVDQGRSLVIIGGSGQGKSVTIKIAIGLMRPDAGKVLVDGRDVTRLSPAGRRELASGRIRPMAILMVTDLPWPEPPMMTSERP
jgi:ABC-type transporter Mla maintaining outer membrane lipid asymmetry ATPase subunit MlaF